MSTCTRAGGRTAGLQACAVRVRVRSFTSPWMKNEPDATTFDGDSDDDMDDSFFSVSRRELFFGVQGNDSENAENVEKQGKKRENEENVEKNLWLIGKVYLKQGKWASLFQ
eukprot:867508-Pleurochrysis_carterae.AAC.1